MRFSWRFMALAMAAVICSTNTAFAASYTDVDKNHWAYSSIDKMSDKGFIVGNISGEYKPDNAIDKFETAKILALVSGYKYTGLSSEEQNYYDRAYEKNKNLLNSYSTKFARWNSTTDREIAYLLEKEIFVESDLAQFVVINNAQENLRALSRQEAAVFLVKLMGKKSEALAGNYAGAFLDDSKIDQSARPYVYYLKNIGVISGGADNNFNPNGAVTRAAMAVLLDKTIAVMEENGTQLPGAGTASVPDASVANIETISGQIDKIHASLGALQIIYSSGEVKIHKVDATANIYVDGFIKTIHELKEGMPFVGILNNGNLVDIKAQAASDPLTSTMPPANPSGTTQPVDTESHQTIQGIVTYVSPADSGQQSITIEVKTINPLGGVIVERTPYTLDTGCTITRGGIAAGFTDIVADDVVKAKVSGNKALSIELAEKDRAITGVVVDKRTDPVLGTKIYVVEDAAGNTHQLAVAQASKLTRKDFGAVLFDDIRIGDTIDLTAEYSTIITAHADGIQSIKDGFIREIHITQDGTSITVEEPVGENTLYRVIEGAFDIYTLRLNAKVRLRLDSKEVEMVSVLQEAEANYHTGYIDSVSSNYITVRATPSATSSTSTIKVSYDASTIVTDYTTGAKVTAGNLYKNMKVYIIFSDSASNSAKSIAILSK